MNKFQNKNSVWGFKNQQLRNSKQNCSPANYPPKIPSCRPIWPQTNDVTCPGPHFGEDIMSKLKNKSQNLQEKQNDIKIAREKSEKSKSKTKKGFEIIINFVPFENDNDRQKSYELWVESFFNRSN